MTVMNEKVGEVFSIAKDNQPVPGCTSSKAVYSGMNDILYFSLDRNYLYRININNCENGCRSYILEPFLLTVSESVLLILLNYRKNCFSSSGMF